MTTLVTPDRLTAAPTSYASRRAWLKGFGALFGTSLLAVPGTLLARPAVGSDTTTAIPVAADAASDLVGGDEYIGMVKLLTGTTVPTGWALCEGQVLPTAQHPALFAVLKSTYGGDGRHTFALPDMRADMTAMAALDDSRPAGAEPMGRLCAIKVANAPALPMAAAELRLAHQRRRLLA